MKPSPGHGSRSKLGRWLVRAAVSGGALAWLVWRIEWTPLVATFAAVDGWLCLAGLTVYCSSHLVSSCRWRLLAQAVGIHEPLTRFVPLYYVGVFFNVFLPTSMGGDVVRAWYLGSGLPAVITDNSSRGIWLAGLSVLSDRLSGLLALLLLASLAAFASLDVMPMWAAWTVWGMATATAGVLLALPLLGRWHPKFRDLAQSLSLGRQHGRQWGLAFLLSLIVQAACVLEVWLLGQALGLSAPWLAYAVAAPLTVLLTMLPITINGIGVREGSLVLLLAGAGVAPAEALALGLLWLGITLAASLLGGAVYLLGGFSRPELRDAYGSVRGDSDQGRAGQSRAAA